MTKLEKRTETEVEKRAETGVQRRAETGVRRRAETLQTFAQSFDISYYSVWRAVKRGALRTIRIGGRHLVPLAEIERVEREGLDF